ncbi:MAG: CvpA family protein [Kiritimatiellae bacterium]|nr:CvpA family protein [Kiritimatiellia bacterium]
MEAFTVTDLAIGVMTVIFMGIGLWRGISGEIASFVGLLVSIFSSYLFYGVSCTLAGNFGFTGTTHIVIAALITVLFGILVYGITWFLVNKFISICVRQPTNAILGSLIGFGKALAIVVILIWFNIVGVDGSGWLDVKTPPLNAIFNLVHQF